jgi:hypothetical protein
VQIPYRVTVEQRVVEIPVLLEDFGAQCGMLLVTEWSTIAPIADQLVVLGFGYSCLSEPSNTESREGLAEMLSDWGWSRPDQPSPGLAAFLAQHERCDDTD